MRLGDMLDRVGATPATALVFLGSAALLATLHLDSCISLRAPAVAMAPTVAHTAAVGSLVEKVHVRPGDMVAKGAPLFTLSGRFLERELALVDAELAALAQEARVAQLELVEERFERELEAADRLGEARVESARAKALAARQSELLAGLEREAQELKRRHEERLAREEELRETTLLLERERAGATEASLVARSELDRLRALEQQLKTQPELPLLSRPMEELYAAKLAALRAQRDGIADELSRATMTSQVDGRVAAVLPEGSSVGPGTAVVTVVPERASEIVAYLPPETPPSAVPPGAKLVLAGAAGPCAAPASVLRLGGAVEQAPGQLGTPLRTVMFGLPVHASVPAGCELGVGQVLSVELARGGP